ncbi:AEC family transporter, partial [Escherichia coli]|uniref:AEC family transporter n=2 Tax=Escherichia coli TaxID=562 RepID=UPI00208FC969
ELYASRIGHYDAGNLRGSTPPVFPFIYHCAPYLMGWDVFITFLKLILMPLALLLVGMACHLNSEHLQMMVLAGALPPAFSGIIIASRFNVYTRTGTASLAVSVLGFVVTAPLWIYVSRLVS